MSFSFFSFNTWLKNQKTNSINKNIKLKKKINDNNCKKRKEKILTVSSKINNIIL